MESEDLFELWLKMEEYINPKDKKEAIDVFLQYCYEHDANIYEIMESAENYGDMTFVKLAKRFIKENGNDEVEW